MRKIALIGPLALVLSTPAFGASPEEEAAVIVREIVGVCQTQGMLACEPRFQGVPKLFEYVRLFEQLDRIQKQFNQFLAERYETEAVDFDILQASLKLELNISFTPGQFLSRVTETNKVKDGYDLIMKQGEVIRLRKVNGSWIARLPETSAKQFEQLRPYFLAGQIKRSILVYRMLEADLAKLSKDELEANVSQDIAPIFFLFFSKEKFPKLLRWAVKDADDVIGFYSQFENAEQMRAHIIRTHDL